MTNKDKLAKIKKAGDKRNCFGYITIKILKCALFKSLISALTAIKKSRKCKNPEVFYG